MSRREAEHNSQDVFFRSPVGAAEAGSTVQLGIRMKDCEPQTKVILRLWQESAGEKLIELANVSTKNEKDCFYRTSIEMPKKGGLLWYYFIITSPDEETWYYGNNMEHLGGLGGAYDGVPPSFQITVYNKGAKTPDWMKTAVMYQIFPDRFYRKGNGLIEKKGAVIHASWEDQPCYYKDVDTKEIVHYDFFGGNLKGIEEKLPYLQELGISLIYLNPVFESPSNHHYDTGDYHKIDPLLGTNEDFEHLIEKAREHGIRLIIDGVFSHTGSDSIYFNRDDNYESLGAFQSPLSPYYEWYNFHKYPYEYDSWWGFSTLPNVNETTPSYMDFIIRDENSVLRHWMKAGISGWRLDVIDELPEKFTQTFYQEMKKIDPDAVLVGEVWEDASNKIAYGVPREYLCGQEIDSAMNYPFRKAVLDFLLNWVDGRQTMRILESLRENYPKENFYVMMNLIDSHDVERAITLLGEAPFYDGMPAIHQSRFKLDAEHYTLGCLRLQLASMWQMTYPGTPCVYYGDEIGMQGFRDPYNRAPYAWSNPDEDLLAWYRKLIRLRNEHPALQTGDFLPLYSEGHVLSYARTIQAGVDAFGRQQKNESFVVVLNRSRDQAANISIEVGDFADGAFENALDPEERIDVLRGKIALKVPPLSGRIYRLVPKVRRYERKAGILLHPTSLPSPYGIGDLGGSAYSFVDFLQEAGQKVWQILPLNPVGFGYSPYQSPSAFAGNPMLISLDQLVDTGLLLRRDVKQPNDTSTAFIDYERVWSFKRKQLRKAFEAFKKQGFSAEYKAFTAKEDYWLEDYALFEAIKEDSSDRAWYEWEDGLKRRQPEELRKIRERLADEADFHKFLQYHFHRQWRRLKEYAKERGIKIMGDMPIFVSHDSVDVWTHQHLFKLNPDGTAKTVAGVPPDYFSATGQLWGNPQYDWTAMKKDGYAWWKSRFKKLAEQVDIIRIDHFRGFESYWEVDAKAKTAVNGSWVKGPGKPFFDEMKAALGNLEIVAEDLGVITDAVEKLRDDCGFPGMKVLHFSLFLNDKKRIGFRAPENSVIYTGTHDNNTTVGWFLEDLDLETQAAVAELLGVNKEKPKDVAHALIEFAYASESRLAIIPMQDVRKMSSRSRMNLPGTVGVNWRWCLKDESHREEDAKFLRELAEKYER
ncbi:bifunctional glycogen debranching protein GlgX/4-alpha-glucanotransferase [Selenomonas sp. TAMA-11512]|uniref:4-alpha-glucanotransferase n=1 Tax=Selenomonas sp. TAMA-11512 TaxID=3095337 RepID=UPI0030934B41|nr:bifunctional glycogen debranching protein GlgX/4-alpha-glucanotransferase [Selenomonas sp. TAMA-11512]